MNQYLTIIGGGKTDFMKKFMGALLFTCLFLFGCDVFKIIPTEVNKSKLYVAKGNFYEVSITANLIKGANIFQINLDCTNGVEIDLDSIKLSSTNPENITFNSIQFVSKDQTVISRRNFTINRDNSISIGINYTPLKNRIVTGTTEALILPCNFLLFKGEKVISDTLRIQL